MSDETSGTVLLREITWSALRNLVDDTLRPDPGINLVCGDNGQGKTALLEAIYLVATSKSFRASRLREVVQHERSAFSVRATFLERRGELPPLDRAQTIGFARGATQLRVDGNEPDTIVSYARRSPVVVFHPDELQLSSGPAALRRRLLDRLSLYLVTASLRSGARYLRALRARQELLRRPSSSANEIEAFERIAAEEGAALTRVRAAAVERFHPALTGAFAKIAAPDLTLTVAYEPGGSADAERALDELAARRARDASAKIATFGPHRDELALALDGHPVRHVASQGQHRAVALAMKLAESATIAESTGLWPIQLLDDISSELDETRTEALLVFLEQTRGQLFITGTREGLLREAFTGKIPQVFRMVKGAIQTA
jgi:DNA replication and repair protein RecF